jgi:hypothetical protein
MVIKYLSREGGGGLGEGEEETTTTCYNLN